MIPRMRAVAIDDEADHLEAINLAAIRAGFGCLPLHYPNDIDTPQFESCTGAGTHIRLIITDLHLNTTSQTSPAETNYATIGGLILKLSLPSWTPFVLVLWTQHPGDAAGLDSYLQERLPRDRLPSLLIHLDKAQYRIPGSSPDHEKLWTDLSAGIMSSRGLNVLLQWEKEIIQSADNVVRKLLEVARLVPNANLSMDQEIDHILSLVSQGATSRNFAAEEPRAAANEGLLPLLVDEMEHLPSNAQAIATWQVALQNAVKKIKCEPKPKEHALLNDALHISRDCLTTGADRGAVVSVWHTADEIEAMFGLKPVDYPEAFGLTAWPEGAGLRYVQIEGLCDSVQQKKGVVPFVFACEVPEETKLKESFLPASVQPSPSYMDPHHSIKKIILNHRYFFTAERSSVKARTAEFRIRESLINSWAYTWSKHATRPGTVEFHLPQPKD